MRLITLLVLACAMGCGPKQSPSSTGTVAQNEADDPFADIEQRYESFRGPLMLNAWHEGVGEPTEDVQHHQEAYTAFFSDEALTTRLAELAQSADPGVREKALGWIEIREQGGLHKTETIASITSRIVETMDGPADHPLHGKQALMVLYGSPDAEARDEAQKEIQRRSELMFPLLAERSQALNSLAQEAGYEDYVHAQSGLSAGEAIQQVQETCSSQMSVTQSGFDRLVERGAAQLGRAPTEADYFALSTGWSAEAGSFMKSDTFYALSGRALKQMGLDLDAMNIQIRETPGSPGGAAYSVSIPDDVRFRGFFPDGFEGARGWFHELGHAIHMKEVKETEMPFRRLPSDRALSEGIGEIFAAILRDADWLSSEFPDLTEAQRSEYIAATQALDALVVRYNCHQTLLELSLYEGELDMDRLAVMHEEFFGASPTHGPSYNLYIYLPRPLYTWEYVRSTAVTATFLERLGESALLSEEAGDLLRTKVLAPGAKLTMKGFFAQE